MLLPWKSWIYIHVYTSHHLSSCYSNNLIIPHSPLVFFLSIIICTWDGCLVIFTTLGFFHIHFHSIVSSKKYRLSSNRPRSTITDIEARDTSVQFTNAQPITPRSTTFPLTSSVSQVPSVITPSASEMRSHCVTLPPI